MSFEAIAYARKRGTGGAFEEKWMTVPTDDRTAAFAAFQDLGFECRGMAILTQEEATAQAAKL